MSKINQSFSLAVGQEAIKLADMLTTDKRWLEEVFQHKERVAREAASDEYQSDSWSPHVLLGTWLGIWCADLWHRGRVDLGDEEFSLVRHGRWNDWDHAYKQVATKSFTDTE